MRRFLTIAIIASLPLGAVHAGDGSDKLSKCWENNDKEGLTACLDKALEQSKLQRQEAEEQTRREAEELDANMYYRRAEAYKESSVAFDTYLEKECGRQLALAAPGTGMGDFWRACQIDLITQRIKMLEGK